MPDPANIRLAYTVAQAAATTGYSIDVIRRGIRAGDIATVAPTVNGRKLSRAVIVAAELERWLNSGVSV